MATSTSLTNWITLASFNASGSVRLELVTTVLATLTLLTTASLVIRSYAQLRDTTLTAAWCWTLCSLTCLIAGQWFGWLFEESGVSTSVRYLTGISTLCPVMAVFGAKRPQERGWQFIVLSLWAVLALPALQQIAFAPASDFEPHAAWQGFIMLLIFAGSANWLPTRFGLPILLATAAQLLLIGTVPDWCRSPRSMLGDGVPALMLAGSAWLARRRLPKPAILGWDRVWCDFRDAFGVVWALRIAERINASAVRYDWPVRLQWYGFRRLAKDHPGDGVDAEFDQSIRTLLRRFVSADWIDRRLKADELSAQ